MATAEALYDEVVGIHAGSLEVRLAQTEAEIDAAQAMRYRIFFEEGGAVPSADAAARRRDVDRFDSSFDHLIVIDHAKARPGQGVVGTYRLNRASVAARAGGFYSAGEYDLGPLLRAKGEVLELGRSCVDRDYRNGLTMALLWRGISAYIDHYDITFLFGCASLSGTDPERLALPLSYLYHHHLAPAAIRPRALPELYVPMDRIAREALDVRAGRDSLPPLIKGYLRVGGFVGDGAVVDRQFQSTDVCIVVEVKAVTAKYRTHHGHAGRVLGIV